MLSQAQRKAISTYAAQEVRGNDDYHALPHLRQTARVAVKLAKAEKADPEVCWAAAMLHDIRKESKGDHGAVGAKAATEFLATLNLPKGFIEKVRDAINFHNKGFRGGPKERGILWDADKLPMMSPKGFRERLLPFWVMKKGKKEALPIAIREYHFFSKRFHTKAAKKLVERDKAKMERLIERLRG